MTDPPPGTPHVTRDRVAAAVDSLRAADLPVTCTTVRAALDGGSDRDIHRYLQTLDIGATRTSVRQPTIVPQHIAHRIMGAIAGLIAANLPLLHASVRRRSRARGNYVTVVLRHHLAVYGHPWPPIPWPVSDEDQIFVVIDDSENTGNDAILTHPHASQVREGSVTKAPERCAQDTHLQGIHPHSRSSQVTLPGECNTKDTPPAYGRRTPTPTSPFAAARGASRFAGPSARHAAQVDSSGVLP